MNPWATSRCGSYDRLVPSGSGDENPALLSNGAPQTELKRPFHINAGKNAVFRTIGARRMFLGPARSGPTIPLLSIPIAIGWLSPKPFVGEWQPAQLLSPCRPVTVSNHSSRPIRGGDRPAGRGASR